MRIRNLLLLLAALFAAASPAAAGEKEDDTKADIEAAIYGAIEAYRSGDGPALDALLTTPYSHINNGGEPVDRAAYVNWVGSRKEKIEAGTVKVSKYDIENMDITMLNDTTAVATGFAKIAGETDGRVWSIDFRFTKVLMKEDGQWKRAAFHDTYLRRD